MATLDWILLAVLTASMLMGVWRGLVREVLSLAGWIAGFLLAQMFAPDVGARLPMEGASEGVRYLAGFVVVFLMVLVLTALSGWVLQKLVAAVGLGILDRMLGAVFGTLRGMILLLVITVIVGMTPVQDTAVWRQSQGAQTLTQLLHFLKPVMPADFGKYLP
jgi:membrane protein required for colicin V production